MGRPRPTLPPPLTHTPPDPALPIWRTQKRWTNVGSMSGQRFNIGSSLHVNYPANTIHRPNVGTMLGQRRRRWTNIVPALGWCIVFAVFAGLSGSMMTFGDDNGSDMGLDDTLHCHNPSTVTIINTATLLSASIIYNIYRSIYILRDMNIIDRLPCLPVNHIY